jgi:putative ABC transport system permease protein
MFTHYLRVGFRNLTRTKLFTAINISGMAISIACFLIIVLFVYDELQYDKHVHNASYKFRVYNDYFEQDGSQRKFAIIAPMIAPTMQAEFPEVGAYARYMKLMNPVLFEYEDLKFSESTGGYADPYILQMFSLKLLEGDVRTALQEPNMIAISSTLKKKYFGDEPALGHVIQIDHEDFKVSAVFEDFARHSHLQVDYFIAIDNLIAKIPERMQRWEWDAFYTYVELASGTNPSSLDSKLKTFAERHAWPLMKGTGTYYIPHLMPLTDIHLHASDHMWDIAIRGNAQTIYILSATAVFILVIAILNFINLSTARAVARMKEVGVRKVVGAFRTQLIYQFISESVIVAFIALVIGGVSAELALPALNNFADKAIPYGIFLDPTMIVYLLVSAFAIGMAAGAYPAFYISNFKPVHIFSHQQARSGKAMLRKALVVLQFVLSFFLIIASFVVSDQHRYLQMKDMGFNKTDLVTIELRGEMQSNLETTRQSFSAHPGIISASFQYGVPGGPYAGETFIDLETKKNVSVSMLLVDHNYTETLALNLIAGRDFDRNRPSDELDAFIISEEGTKALGYTNPEDALGHRVAWPRWDAPDSLKHGKIIGVVKDFHLTSLRDKVSPVMMHIFPYAYTTATFRIKSDDVPATLQHLENTWKKFNTEWPFEYRFLDDNFDRFYKSEEKLAVLFSFFTGFTIFVACLGLFGLVVYNTSMKYKEISIRKVFGAGDSDLVFGLTQSYMLLIAIAFVIAIPVSNYAAHQWLQKFAYHIDVTPWLFMKAGLMIMLIAVITVGIQSLKAARSNPVDALKER